LVSSITTLDREGWDDAGGSSGHAEALERGDVLFLRGHGFEMAPAEARFLSPGLAGAAKNVSFDPVRRRVSGTALEGDDRTRLAEWLARFSAAAATRVRTLLPTYRDRLETGRASFRPVEIAGRSSSWRKDDTRLHIDSFPATPVQGRRILRLFCNVNPDGRPRTWRVGDDFESVARRFASHLRSPLPGSSALLRLLRVTKSRRSAYDALMLQLHDFMKADADFQSHAPQLRFDFPPQSTWIAFTDQVSHAAMAGQYQLEQTFLLPVPVMLDEQRSPLRILERLVGRRLA
jgi:hypothetical protein